MSDNTVRGLASIIIPCWNLVDDARQVKQVPGQNRSHIGITEEITREDILGRVHPWNLRSEQPGANFLALEGQP